MTRIGFAMLALFLLAGCTAGQAVPEGLPDTGNPALHALHDSRLRQLMLEMNTLMFDRMRTELELDKERRKQALNIAETAAAMQKTVGYIIDTLPRLALGAHEQTTFLMLAEQLRSRVETLETLARRNYIDVIPGALEQVEATCTGCHRLFRKLEPEPGQGS